MTFLLVLGLRFGFSVHLESAELFQSSLFLQLLKLLHGYSKRPVADLED